ncbi:hypothetical protein J6590_102941 [Homalodisca vitripennis]|nr:hypothetical protein J6590_102941 [Homalodisca vitripennis]
MAQCSGYNGYRKITRSNNGERGCCLDGRSCPCKQSACPVIGSGSEVTFKPFVAGPVNMLKQDVFMRFNLQRPCLIYVSHQSSIAYCREPDDYRHLPHDTASLMIIDTYRKTQRVAITLVTCLL